MKYNENPSSGSRCFSDAQTDRPPDPHIQTPISFDMQLNNCLTFQLRLGLHCRLFPVFLYNPDDGNRRLSKMLVLTLHMTRRRAPEDWNYQHHYGNIKFRAGNLKCLVV
jgi:hypothetical protein